MKVSNLIIELDDVQLDRCYKVFDFNDDEYITVAYYYKDEDKLVIEYISEYDMEKGLRPTKYEPDLDSIEGQEKLNYILFGRRNLV